MRKIIIPLLCVGLLCGCADKAESSANEASVTKSTTAVEITAAVSSTAVMTTTETAAVEVQTTSHAEFASIRSILFNIERKPEALYITDKDTGELVQTIEGNFSSEVDQYEGVDGFEEHYYQGVEVLEFADYDFDGYDDIFFQTSINTANEPGIYYHFNPETCLFEEWDELNKIGLQCYFGDDKTLKVSVTGSAVDHETTVYKWENECLVPVSREIQYADGKNDIYIDYYEYNENSEEILVKREKAILDEKKNWIGTEEVEIPEVIK